MDYIDTSGNGGTGTCRLLKATSMHFQSMPNRLHYVFIGLTWFLCLEHSSASALRV